MNANQSFEQLETYIREQMRMSHVYQPVMLQVLLQKGGSASTEDVAKALLSYDRSQVEYYEIRTKSMVGKVLTQNGVIELACIRGPILTHPSGLMNAARRPPHGTLDRQAYKAILPSATAYLRSFGLPLWRTCYATCQGPVLQPTQI